MAEHPTIADAARELEEEFALLEDWRDKVEYIIELGKDLPPLPEALKTEGNKVRGCQSQVWLVAEPEAGGRHPSARRQRRRAGQGTDLAAAAASTTGARRRRSWTIRPTCWSGWGWPSC